jgi:hypothetical protein
MFKRFSFFSFNMSKLDKRLPKNATDTGDHPSINSIEEDV